MTLPKPRWKAALMLVLAAFMVFIGVLHFTSAGQFVQIVPAFLPSPYTLVWVSGVFEILGGVGLLVDRTRRFSAWGLVALYVAVFPANINMAVNHIHITGTPELPAWVLWARLPFQAAFIAAALTFTPAER